MFSLPLFSPATLCYVGHLQSGQNCLAGSAMKDINRCWQDWLLVSLPWTALRCTCSEFDWKCTHKWTVKRQWFLINIRVWGRSRYMWSLMTPGINGRCCRGASPVTYSRAECYNERWAFPACSAGKHWQELTSAQRGHCAAHGSLQRMGYHGNTLFRCLSIRLHWAKMYI